MRKRAIDASQDNTAAGVVKRAKYAEQSIMNEVEIVGSEVGMFMATCAVLGCAVKAAGRAGVSKCEFKTMVIELLYSLDNPVKEQK
jgi:hypothetical protein